MVVKIPFKNKSYGSQRVRRSSSIIGDLFVKFIIGNNDIQVKGAQMILHQGTEFNEHQQKTFSTTSGLRKMFSGYYGVNFTNQNKKINEMNNEQLTWWNNKLKFFGSLLSISKHLTGNNPSGAQSNKKYSEFILRDGIHAEKTFFNLLRTFTREGKLEALDFNYTNNINFNEFLDLISKISNEYQFIISNFYDDEFKYFYIDEMMEYLGTNYKDKREKLRNEFRNQLIGTYDRVDQFYNIFRSRKMVEAAHIKPVKHIINSNDDDNQIKDVSNGLLLSPDIHKLFDSGAITFNSENGKVIYTTNHNKAPFNITLKEVERLELNNYELDKKLLTKDRVEYLEYHNKYVFQQGV